MRPTPTYTPMEESLSHPPAKAVQFRSPWHTPVPYLFGGLAAMLGLIAFALLILACSYWKPSGQSSDNESGVENGGENLAEAVKPAKVYEENIVVIMAGDDKPTYLATPASNSALFEDANGEKTEQKNGKTEEGENVEKETSDHEQITRTENRERHHVLPYVSVYCNPNTLKAKGEIHQSEMLH